MYFVSGNEYRQFMWNNLELAEGVFQFDRHFFGCGRLQDGSNTYEAENGQTSSRTVRNWALVPTMVVVSVAACHVIL